MAGNLEAGNSLKITVTAVVGQHSRVTVPALPSDVIGFLQCCPIREFGGKQFHC